MKRSVSVVLVSTVCLAVALLSAGCSKTTAQGGTGGGGGRGGRGGGVQPVVVAKVSQKDVPVDIAAVGNVEAYNTIAVRSQVTGQPGAVKLISPAPCDLRQSVGYTVSAT